MHFITCPTCGITIEIIEFNCCIFRCGVYKHNLSQIHPHLPKEACDQLVAEDKIYGCGKPFRVIRHKILPPPEEHTINSPSDQSNEQAIKSSESPPETEKIEVILCDYI